MLLSTRIALSAGVLALVGVAALSTIQIRSERRHLQDEVIVGSESLAETIGLSIKQDMRANRQEGVREMLESVGQHAGIERVRIYNKEGEITHSSDSTEVGTVVDKRAEACVTCHYGPSPNAHLNPEDRSRVFTNPDGSRVLSTIQVIRNEAGCSGARCHASPAQQSVLGVLDVTMSLEPAEARLLDATRSAFLTSLLAVLMISAGLFFLISHRVRRPINRMIAATRRVASGDFRHPVSGGATGEIGFLVSSFNDMVASLSSSSQHIEDWVETLEQNVAEKASQLRAAQYQVVQAEKLSSVGLVAAGIAHELNSPLMAIITYAHLVHDTLPSESQARDDVQMIVREANRCAAIIRQLLDFSRKQDELPEPEPSSVQRALQKAVELLKIELQNAGVELRTSIPDDLPMVEANEVQLQQVFVNLMMNAIHAMPDGGRLTVKADIASRGDYANVKLPPHHGTSLVRIRVRDTGTGIAPEDLGRIFDPFFTTKPVGQGSGLGLSVSMGLVRRYRGAILASSDGRSGAEFTVLLPVPALSMISAAS